MECLEFYGLGEQPFGVTADPRFLYPSPVHLEALGCLLYGIRNDLGFNALIAEPGLGKTTLLVHVLETFRSSALTAFIFETQCTSMGLLRYLLKELNICTEEKDPVSLHERLQGALVGAARAGRRVLLIIDEAQNLDLSVLESVRLLSNFESRRGKLLHIVLSGQPQLADRLGRPELAQLRQRLWMMNCLRPLPPDEVARYVEHRLRVAGYSGNVLFSEGALEAIAVRSGGIPREINRICFSTLSVGWALRESCISKEIVEEAASDYGMRWVGLQQVPDRAAERDSGSETTAVAQSCSVVAKGGRVGGPPG